MGIVSTQIDGPVACTTRADGAIYSVAPGRVRPHPKEARRTDMNGIPKLSPSAVKWRLNGYADGRAGRRPRRTGMDYADGYRAGATTRRRLGATT